VAIQVFGRAVQRQIKPHSTGRKFTGLANVLSQLTPNRSLGEIGDRLQIANLSSGFDMVSTKSF
jgi:hypothetical protein